MTNPTPFQQGYIECALWASSDGDGTPLDSGDYELSDDARACLMADALAFETTHRALLDRANDDFGRTDVYLGHDFWLTRNGHGAGFWDRGMGEVGDALTLAAQACGAYDPYVGDDGMIYVA